MFEMTMKLDQDVLSALRLSPDEFANEMRLAAATHWYNVTRFLRKKQPKLLDRTVPISSGTENAKIAFVVDFADLEANSNVAESAGC